MAFVVREEILYRHLARDPKVQGELRSHCSSLALTADVLLASHRDMHIRPGDTHHKIKIERVRNKKFGHIDWFVSLVGPAPISVEYGHRDKKSGRFVRGTYVMTVTAASAAL